MGRGRRTVLLVVRKKVAALSQPELGAFGKSALPLRSVESPADCDRTRSREDVVRFSLRSFVGSLQSRLRNHEFTEAYRVVNKFQCRGIFGEFREHLDAERAADFCAVIFDFLAIVQEF